MKTAIGIALAAILTSSTSAAADGEGGAALFATRSLSLELASQAAWRDLG